MTWKGIEKARDDVAAMTREAVDGLEKFPGKDGFLRELLISVSSREK